VNGETLTVINAIFPQGESTRSPGEVSRQRQKFLCGVSDEHIWIELKSCANTKVGGEWAMENSPTDKDYRNWRG